MKRACAVVVATILITAIYHPLIAPACGPFFPEIIFVNTVHPDLPVGPYTEGSLGVVQPSYQSIFLYVAYRNLVGQRFSPAEQQALWSRNPALMKENGFPRFLTPEQVQAGQFPRPEAPQPATPINWEQLWKQASGSSAPAQPPPPFAFGILPGAGVYKQVVLHQNNMTFYSQYLNCPQDAFRAALATLKARTAQFGASSAIVRSWVKAQENVFSNCSARGVIPEALPETASNLARADRAYQIAAAHFYAGNYDQAISEFRAIAQDTSSSWHTIAPYLVARALVRKATVISSPTPNLAVLAQAKAQIESVLANPGLAKYHGAAKRLRGFVDFRLHPKMRMVELAKDLVRPDDPNLAQNLTDFTRLFRRWEGDDAYATPRLIRPEMYSKLAGIRAQSDLLDWMFTMRLSAPEAYNHALEKWEATHSRAWLVAALTKAMPGSPHLAELLSAAGEVTGDTPAFNSVNFQSLRLLLLEGEDGQARAILAHRLRALGTEGGLFAPVSDMNLFGALRFELAQNFNELLKNAPRSSATITDGTSADQMPSAAIIWPGAAGLSAPAFDDDALIVFNRLLPLSMLARAVHSPLLPVNLRREIALAAWTRAALLGETAVARSLAPAVETFDPELTASVRAYDIASSPRERRFEAALTMLRFPGLRPYITTPGRGTPVGEIDNLRDNWWASGGPCQPFGEYWSNPELQPGPSWPRLGPIFQAIYPSGQINPPSFLTASDRAKAAREWQRLIAIGTAPDYLTMQAISQAKTDPGDPRVPEALALAVRATRFGCVDQKTGGLSKAAFDLLHQHYSKSSWANKTKYWFKM
jgi:hypothetical protein